MSLRATRNFNAVDPAAYLTLAIEWSRSADDTTLRSAVDRAYYAAFLTTRDQLSGKGYGHFTADPQVHSQVAKLLSATNKNAGEKLIILRRARNRLNYQTGNVTLPRGQSVRSLMLFARIVVEAAQELPNVT